MPNGFTLPASLFLPLLVRLTGKKNFSVYQPTNRGE